MINLELILRRYLWMLTPLLHPPPQGGRMFEDQRNKFREETTQMNY
jgi:hypothetical protein